MKLPTLLLLLFMSKAMHAQTQQHKISNPAIAIHGGASNIKNLQLTPEQEKAYLAALDSALLLGYNILMNGGNSVDAVSAAVVYLEDNPLFNAGKGSVFAADSSNHMDAAIMSGANLKCGAVSGIKRIKNPILLAKKIMETSPYIFLYGEGAESFGTENGFDLIDPSYFKTAYRWQQFLKVKGTDTLKLDNDIKGGINPIDDQKFEKYGTVGAVAIDQYGNLAAATSTGGLLNKKYERIGDSPLIGAGTYANNQTCAVSCTGKGEDFIRLAVAHEISSRIKFKHETIKKAVQHVIQQDLKEINGRGGCIAIDSKGNIAVSFTTSGMFHGYIDSKGEKHLGIYSSDK